MSIKKNIKVNIMSYVLLLYSLLFNSCQNNEDIILNKLKGDWSIEQISYDNNNYLNNLYTNVFFLEDHNSVTLPQTFDSEEENAIWNISKKGNNIIVEIKSKNQIFNSKFEVKFIKNYDKKLLGIELKSHKTRIVAYKFLQDFENNSTW